MLKAYNFFSKAGSLVLLTFLTQLVHSLNFVKHAPSGAVSAGAPSGPAKAAASAVLLLGSASAAASNLAPRAVAPYVSRLAVPMSRVSKGPLLPAGSGSTVSSRLIRTGPSQWNK